MCSDLKIDNIRVMRQDVFRYLTSTQTSFDFIFADPPYQLENITDIPDLVFKHNHLNTDGLLIVEHGAKTSFADHPNFVDHRNYGNVHFSFFRTLEYKNNI
jgi:16S rRNA G966 N2-methylase RsmD